MAQYTAICYDAMLWTVPDAWSGALTVPKFRTRLAALLLSVLRNWRVSLGRVRPWQSAEAMPHVRSAGAERHRPRSAVEDPENADATV